MAALVFRFVVDRRRRSVVHGRRTVVRRRRRRCRAVVHARRRFVVDRRRRCGVDGCWRFVVQRRADADGPIHFGMGRSSCQEGAGGQDGRRSASECKVVEAQSQFQDGEMPFLLTTPHRGRRWTRLTLCNTSVLCDVANLVDGQSAGQLQELFSYSYKVRFVRGYEPRLIARPFRPFATPWRKAWPTTATKATQRVETVLSFSEVARSGSNPRFRLRVAGLAACGRAPRRSARCCRLPPLFWPHSWSGTSGVEPATLSQDRFVMRSRGSRSNPRRTLNHLARPLWPLLRRKRNPRLPWKSHRTQCLRWQQRRRLPQPRNLFSH